MYTKVQLNRSCSEWNQKKLGKHKISMYMYYFSDEE